MAANLSRTNTVAGTDLSGALGSLAVIRSAVIHLIDPFCCIPPNDMRTAFRQRIDAEMWESAGSRIHFRLRGGV